ncbi:hypothetical protein ACFYVR_15825 [Rhodococcus sp. NPDC003318]
MMAKVRDLLVEARAHRDAASEAVQEGSRADALYRLGLLDALFDQIELIA